ncbi:MAG: EAL domain-containing protein [Desulfarculales bacterium]|jgi:EAL domain-containing protein (putative c-di-GMP-specific phosphodiesterase class I)/GGDEF domain-containing protein|nr:EAL domain-containing protein [Desulfarculales bacterium]
MKTDFAIIRKILDGGFIKPVYQPIISLQSGEIMGYEALSRITAKELQMNIENMFHAVDKMGCSWELETLCRMKALENAVTKPEGKKLFLNVNSNIIYDENFKNGFTKKFLRAYGINADDIVFEITERVAVSDKNAFQGSISHYKNQRYGIAIDDVGAGFSGLNMIISAQPDFLKLDMNLIRNIDKDDIKTLLCKAIAEFCRNANINLIAEGIETEEELKELIKLGVQFGQGYFLGTPQETFAALDPHVSELISTYYSKHYIENARSSVYPIIEHLCKRGQIFSPQAKGEEVYEHIKAAPMITEVYIVDGEKIVGFLSKLALNEYFGGRYGYSLNYRKTVQEIMRTDFFRSGHNMPVDLVARLAMQRPYEQLYDPIIVEKEGKFRGAVTIKDLLEACAKIQIDIAMHANPLTGLPGNLLLEKEIKSRIFGQDPFCITYYDLDNFKGYNDAYGFINGDLMLKLLASLLQEQARKNEFVGHIGGDDFIVIADYHDGEAFCQDLLAAFADRVLSLYRPQDVERGYIVSKNRHGVTENFPLASLSIAGISNRKKTYQTLEDFSQDVSALKKICKRHVGSYYEIW